MPLRVTQLDEATRPAFERLLAQVWGQTWGEELARALIRWRYDERTPAGETWLAMDGEECVAMVDSFLRPYLLDGRHIVVRETCDWFCLPRYRPLGVGIRLMRQLMACPEPLISIGGSDANLAILPRLGWTELPAVERCLLPIKARNLAGTWLRAKWPAHEGLARAIPGFIALRPARPAPPPGGISRVSEWNPDTAAPLPIPDRDGLVELLSAEELTWMTRIPAAVAQPLCLAFHLGEELVGFVYSQIEFTASGRDGCIVHLQVARDSLVLAEWIVAETARRLALRGVGIIRCCASTPAKTAALRKAGFISWKPWATFWWPKPDMPVPAQIDAGYLRADDFFPFTALRGRWMATAHEGAMRSAA